MSAAQLKALFADLAESHQISFTNIGSDYMEDWQRLSSMMLLDVFWQAVDGQKVLVFQPDAIMCARSTRRIGDFTHFDYVGPPMAGPWWMTSDDPSQWSVGCGGFSLRDRAKSILMSRTAQCITPAAGMCGQRSSCHRRPAVSIARVTLQSFALAGKLEDQQLGAMWKYIAGRCRAAGIQVAKPSRFEAVQFAVEYDLHVSMGCLPNVDGRACPCASYTAFVWSY